MAATQTSYGLGWLSGAYRGLHVVSHGGGTGGFTSEIAFLPEADLGIVVLTNAFALSPNSPVPLAFENAVKFRLFELLFDQSAEFDEQLAAQAKSLAAAQPPRKLAKVDRAKVESFIGRYTNTALGDVSLSLRGDRLVLDTGQLTSELSAQEAGAETVYLLHDPPLSLFSAAYGVTVTFAGDPENPRMTITVPASVTGPEQAFVFTPTR
jgi:hypothetical protein